MLKAQVESTVARIPQMYPSVRSDALTLARSAALGGSRHEAKSVSTN